MSDDPRRFFPGAFPVYPTSQPFASPGTGLPKIAVRFFRRRIMDNPFAEWLKNFLEESIKWYKEKIAELKKRREVLVHRREGWTNPEHMEQPQEKRPVGPEEKKGIDDAIASADEWINRYE